MGESQLQRPYLDCWPKELMHLITISPSKKPEDIEALVELWKMKQVGILCENSKSPQVRMLSQRIVESFPELNVLEKIVAQLPKGMKLWNDFEQFCRDEAHDTNEEISLEEKILTYLHYLDSRFN